MGLLRRRNRKKKAGGARFELPKLEWTRAGRYAAPFRFDQSGVYRVETEARRGELLLGTAVRHVLVGGADLEMSDLALNEPVLQRLATASGGRYLRPDEVAELPGLLRADERPRAGEMKPRQFGPTTRIRCGAAASSTAARSFSPSPLAPSPNPAVTMTAARVPSAPNSATIPDTVAGGVAMTARSGTVGSSAMVL